MSVNSQEPSGNLLGKILYLTTTKPVFVAGFATAQMFTMSNNLWTDPSSEIFWQPYFRERCFHWLGHEPFIVQRVGVNPVTP